MTKAVNCCDDFALAQEHCSDNEGWGRLIHRSSHGEYNIGCDLKPIRFCPWCGTKLTNSPVGRLNEELEEAAL